MKANQRFVNDDDGVSPVIAVILMVAITVVLAATVYLWVSGFGNQTQNVVQATFAAKAVDLPSSVCSDTTACPATTDSDAQDDSIRLTYTAGQADLASSEVYITLDGVKLSPTTSSNNSFADSLTNGAPTSGASGVKYCANLPSGATQSNGFTWSRGASVYVWKVGTQGDCGTFTSGTSGLKGTHNLQVVGKNQVLLDTQIEVHQ